MLEQLKTIILEVFPELHSASFTLLTLGWDSFAVDADDRIIFKFPRDEEAAQALRREAGMLVIVRPKVSLPVPDLAFFETPQVFSKHTKLAGEHLLTAQYDLLDKPAKQRLAEDVALFYAQLHGIDPAVLQPAGVLPIIPWPEPNTIMRAIQPLLPKALLGLAEDTLEQWGQLPADPYGLTYGFFDGHGWNMAFDHKKHKLNGIYDFADSGFGELHQEFIYTSFISPQLTAHVMSHYERLTGRFLDRERVTILTGVLHLVELADMGASSEHASTVLTNAVSWLSKQ